MFFFHKLNFRSNYYTTLAVFYIPDTKTDSQSSYMFYRVRKQYHKELLTQTMLIYVPNQLNLCLQRLIFNV